MRGCFVLNTLLSPLDLRRGTSNDLWVSNSETMVTRELHGTEPCLLLHVGLVLLFCLN